MKVGVTYLPPVWFGALRMAIGAGARFALLVWLRGRGGLSLPPRADIGVLLSVAVLQMAAPMALMHLFPRRRKCVVEAKIKPAPSSW